MSLSKGTLKEGWDNKTPERKVFMAEESGWKWQDELAGIRAELHDTPDQSEAAVAEEVSPPVEHKGAAAEAGETGFFGTPADPEVVVQTGDALFDEIPDVDPEIEVARMSAEHFAEKAEDKRAEAHDETADQLEGVKVSGTGPDGLVTLTIELSPALFEGSEHAEIIRNTVSVALNTVTTEAAEKVEEGIAVVIYDRPEDVDRVIAALLERLEDIDNLGDIVSPKFISDSVIAAWKLRKRKE